VYHFRPGLDIQSEQRWRVGQPRSVRGEVAPQGGAREIMLGPLANTLVVVGAGILLGSLIPLRQLLSFV
jgi:hypothetical protein